MVKSFNTSDLFAKGQKAPFKILYWRQLLFFYILLTLIARLCVYIIYQIEIHFHSLNCLNSTCTDIFQLFLGFMNFNKQFFKIIFKFSRSVAEKNNPKQIASQVLAHHVLKNFIALIRVLFSSEIKSRIVLKYSFYSGTTGKDAF